MLDSRTLGSGRFCRARSFRIRGKYALSRAFGAECLEAKQRQSQSRFRPATFVDQTLHNFPRQILLLCRHRATAFSSSRSRAPPPLLAAPRAPPSVPSLLRTATPSSRAAGRRRAPSFLRPGGRPPPPSPTPREARSAPSQPPYGPGCPRSAPPWGSAVDPLPAQSSPAWIRRRVPPEGRIHAPPSPSPPSAAGRPPEESTPVRGPLAEAATILASRGAVQHEGTAWLYFVNN